MRKIYVIIIALDKIKADVGRSYQTPNHIGGIVLTPSDES